jgi:hypothetical protein
LPTRKRKEHVLKVAKRQERPRRRRGTYLRVVKQWALALSDYAEITRVNITRRLVKRLEAEKRVEKKTLESRDRDCVWILIHVSAQSRSRQRNGGKMRDSPL